MTRVRSTVLGFALSTLLPLALMAQAPAKPAAPKPQKQTQAQLQKEATITLAAATETASKEVPGGKLSAHELEWEKGKLIYSLEFKVPGKSGIDEINVDAKTGTVVDKSHESPKPAKPKAPTTGGAR